MATFINTYAMTEEVNEIKKDINKLKKDFKKFMWKSNKKKKDRRNNYENV